MVSCERRILEDWESSDTRLCLFIHQDPQAWSRKLSLEMIMLLVKKDDIFGGLHGAFGAGPNTRSKSLLHNQCNLEKLSYKQKQ